MLDIIAKSEAWLIDFNNEELKKELELELKKYDIVVTEDGIKEARKLKAKLNKVKGAIDDERKRIKKEYCAPLDHFETQVKELTTMLSNGYDKINNQIKAFEEKELAQKKAAIQEKFNYLQLPIEITFEQLWESSYNNTTMTEKKIIDDMQSKIATIVTNIDIIHSLVESLSESEKMQVMDVYQRTLDINLARQECDRIKSFKKAAETAVKEQPKQDVQEEQSNEMLVRTFQVKATKEQIIRLGNYMNENRIQFRKVEK